VGRWQPNAHGRLEQAALELFAERGYESTTVAEIAERAGLTERTFFRYFADKREVLFSGSGGMREFLVTRVAGAPAGQPPIEVVVGALAEAAASYLEPRRELACRRRAVITDNPELRERELVKLAKMASMLGDALRRRGVEEPAASLAAEAGMTAFKSAYARWAEGGGRGSLADLVRASASELQAVTAAGARPKG